MRVKIKVGDKILDKIAFLKVDNKYDSYIIALDENNEKLRKFNIVSLENAKIESNVFFFESPAKNWIGYVKSKKISGYDWFIADKNARECINNKIDPKILNKCKQMQSKIKINDNCEIKTQKDINDLLYLTSFHDSYVKDISKIGDEIKIVLDTTWGIVVTFYLKGNPKTNLEIGFGNRGEIFDSNMFFENGKIYWVNDFDVKTADNIDTELKYFCAENVSYTIKIV